MKFSMISRWIKAWRRYQLPFRARAFCRRCEKSGKRAVLFARFEALGDVVWVTALMEHYKRLHPEDRIALVTQSRHEPLVSRLKGADCLLFLESDQDSRFAKIAPLFAKVYHLVQERGASPRHLLHDYCAALGLPMAQCNPEFVHPVERNKKTRPKVVVHLGPTWAVRSVDVSILDEAFDLLGMPSLDLVQIGKHAKPERLDAIALKRARNCMNQLGTQDMIEMIARADVFLGVDSGPMHIAAAAGVPIVGLFSSTLPETRLPFGRKNYSVVSGVDCVGCHHADPIGHQREDCPHHVRCRFAYRAEAIAAALKHALVTS